jgi:hypothetical protein
VPVPGAFLLLLLLLWHPGPPMVLSVLLVVLLVLGLSLSAARAAPCAPRSQYSRPMASCTPSITCGMGGIGRGDGRRGGGGGQRAGVGEGKGQPFHCRQVLAAGGRGEGEYQLHELGTG